MKTFLRNTFFFLLPLLAVTACETNWSLRRTLLC